MSKIKHITIEKIWGIKTISTDFDENVNIFIGSNGSSKTTFLSLIEAVLLCDIKVLSSIDFERIIIELTSSFCHYLKVSKTLGREGFNIIYQFDDEKKITIPHVNLYHIATRTWYLRNKEPQTAVLEKLREVVNISWLSVNRGNVPNYWDVDRRELVERIQSSVDCKLEELERSLVMYQLQLEAEANKQAVSFKEKVFSLMLYNENYDIYNTEYFRRFTESDLALMKNELFKAFKALGIVDDKKEAIFQHIDKIKSVIDKMRNGDQIDLTDVFILSLIHRTLSIIDISEAHEKITKQIFLPITKFWDNLKKFMPQKEFYLDTDEEKLKVYLTHGKEKVAIDITSLSSGEKQLFILMAEAVLQRENPYLFIADEPELSLHIEWQQMVLGALMSLNPEAQIIVATHSPEIASNYPDKIKNMANITEYE